MSNYSLAVYCLHRFFLGVLLPQIERFVSSDVGIVSLVVMLTLFLSYCSAFVLKAFLNRKVLF
jgi:hypothetical protein